MIDLKWGLVLPPDILVRYLEGKSCNIISFFKAPFLATPSASNTPPDTLPEGILEAFKTAENLTPKFGNVIIFIASPLFNNLLHPLNSFVTSCR